VAEFTITDALASCNYSGVRYFTGAAFCREVSASCT